MPSTTGIWLRREASATEQRTPLVPRDAAKLVADGVPVTVEESGHRAFPIEEYAAAGCRVAPGDSWPQAPADQVVLGLKEPSAAAAPLTHRHVFFGHAYKGQEGGPALLDRFAAGGGTLLDLEYLTDDSGRRVVAFGHWAGYVGAALAVLHHRGALDVPLTSGPRDELDARLARGRGDGTRALVIGALGRSGRGAVEALRTAGAEVTAWDLAETRTLDKAALLDHDLLVNTVFADTPGTPFLTTEDLLRGDRRLSVVSDVTCDVTSDCNRLPVYDRVTDWAEPVRRLTDAPPLDLIAVDNLPSLLPRESSTDFSGGLLPHLAVLPAGDPVWTRSEEHFRRATHRPTSQN
ncbi:saccharopine dehydrogenase [Streptomyces sp. NPDC097619]|uniref:saccharopine dehydrogenase n=1 Tax=Streptomyces sp. NPDC097619 TaxID=3157228 RepID=UPI00331A6A74